MGADLTSTFGFLGSLSRIRAFLSTILLVEDLLFFFLTSSKNRVLAPLLPLHVPA